MRIINISNLWFHKGEGISEVVINHHDSFKENGVDSVLVQTNYVESKALPVKNKDLFERASKDAIGITGYLNLLTILRRYRGSVYIIHGIFDLNMILSSAFLSLTRQKYIVVPHSSLSISAFRNKFYLKNTLYHLMIKWLLRQASFVMYLNKNEMQSGLYRGNNIEVFPNGVHAYKDSKDILIKRTRNGSHITLLYLGRFDIRHKGLDFLLEFAKFLKEEKPSLSWDLKLYGSDSKGGFAWLTDYIDKWKLNDYVTLNEAVYGKEKEIVLSSSDVFILTSRYEGMPISVLEALKNGLPCLLSKETNMLEVLRDAGVASEFYPDNFERSYESLMSIIDPSKSYMIKEKCVDLIESSYSWKVICKSIVLRIEKI